MIEDMIISVNTLPQQLHRRFRSDKVRVHEENGSIILTPVTNTEPAGLWGVLPEGKFTTEKYLAQKRLDKEMELNDND